MTTTIFPPRKETKKDSPPTLPGLAIDPGSPTVPSKHSPPMQPPGGSTTPPIDRNKGPKGAKPNTPEKTHNEHLRLLSHAEWVQFCHGIGVMKDAESETVIRPTSFYWPAKGFPDGLYRDTVFEKAKFTYLFHIISTIRWVFMLLQLAISAVLTALGTMSSNVGTIITILAAVNTLISGILALLHNSGLPDRFRLDRAEFYKLEEYMKQIVDTKLVPVDEDVLDALGSCFKKFQSHKLAQQTVQNNIPASYTPAAPNASPPPKGLRPAPHAATPPKK